MDRERGRCEHVNTNFGLYVLGEWSKILQIYFHASRCVLHADDLLTLHTSNSLETICRLIPYQRQRNWANRLVLYRRRVVKTSYFATRWDLTTALPGHGAVPAARLG